MRFWFQLKIRVFKNTPGYVAKPIFTQKFMILEKLKFWFFDFFQFFDFSPKLPFQFVDFYFNEKSG